jgi:hypothetical protein
MDFCKDFGAGYTNFCKQISLLILYNPWVF